jgi:hypothetical protein
MVEICEECNQCVPSNGICLSCGKQVAEPKEFLYEGSNDPEAIKREFFKEGFSNETEQYEGNE